MADQNSNTPNVSAMLDMVANLNDSAAKMLDEAMQSECLHDIVYGVSALLKQSAWLADEAQIALNGSGGIRRGAKDWMIPNYCVEVHSHD